MTIPPYSRIPLAVSLEQNSRADAGVSFGKRKLVEEPSFQEVKKNRPTPKVFDWSPMPPRFCSAHLDTVIADAVEQFFQTEPSDPMALSLPSCSFVACDSPKQMDRNAGLLRHLSPQQTSVQEPFFAAFPLQDTARQEPTAKPFSQSFFEKSSCEPDMLLACSPTLMASARSVLTAGCAPLKAATICHASLENEQQCDDELCSLLGSNSNDSAPSTSGMECGDDPLEKATSLFVSLSLQGKGGAFARRNRFYFP